MISKKTVLILGAGASHPYGYPTGDELRTLIILLAQHICSHKPGAEGLIQLKGISLLRETIWRCQNLINHHDPAILSTFEQHQKFLSKLSSDQSSGTIDRFLYDHEQFADIGRFYIMLVLLLCQLKPQFNVNTHVSTNLKECPPTADENRLSQDWYPHLVGKLRTNCDTPLDLEVNNNLSILTFNYDVSLDLHLDNFVDNTPRHSGANWRKVVDLQHLYGSLPYHPSNQSRITPETLADHAWEHKDRIRLIGDRDSKEIEAAKKSIQNAERIVFLGFGFDPDNLSLLDLPDLLGEKHITCHNYTGNPGMNRRIRTKFQEWRNPLRAFAREPSHTELFEKLEFLGPDGQITILPYDPGDFFQGDIRDDITAGLLGLD